MPRFGHMAYLPRHRKQRFALICALCIGISACGDGNPSPLPPTTDGETPVTDGGRKPNPDNCLGVTVAAHTCDFAMYPGAPLTAHVKASAFRLKLSSTIFASFSYGGQSFSSKKKTLDYLPDGQIGFLEVIVDTPFFHILKVEVDITVSGPNCQMTKRVTADWQLNC